MTIRLMIAVISVCFLSAGSCIQISAKSVIDPDPEQVRVADDKSQPDKANIPDVQKNRYGITTEESDE